MADFFKSVSAVISFYSVIQLGTSLAGKSGKPLDLSEPQFFHPLRGMVKPILEGYCKHLQ